MKKLYTTLLAAFIIAANLFSQETIAPRSNYYLTDDLACDKWCYQDGDENVRFFTLADGNMWAFKMSGTDDEEYILRSYVWEKDDDNYEFNFVEKIIESSDHTYTYPCVAFSVNGENFVYAYYKSIDPKDVPDACDYIPYYYRLFYQANPPYGEWITSIGPVEMEHGPLHDEDPNKPVYRSAYVEGDTVYLVYDSYIYVEADENLSCLTSGIDYNSKIYYYSDNSVYVDVCTITSDHNLTRVRRKRISDVMHDDDQHPQQLSGMKIGDDLILLLSYDAGYTSDHEHKGGGVLAYDIARGEKIEDRYFSTARMVRGISGSIQGEGEDAGFGNLSQPNRFQVFFNHFDDANPDSAKHYVKTYAIVEDGDSYDVVEQSSSSRRITGLSNVGDGWGDMMMDVAVKREAYDEVDTIPGNETIRQDIYLFRNDADKEIRCHRFNSDYFSINFSDSSYIESRDFGPGYDEKYEGMNRRLWTLVGIYEGTPPLPMNWKRYQDNFSDKNATSISIVNETDNILTLTSTTDFSIYGKVGVDMADETLYSSVKGTANWINSQTVSHEITMSQNISSVLNNGSFGKAVFLWSVPNLARADMSAFPWWAEDDSQLISGSETSVIWHLAPNDNLYFEVVDMGNTDYYPLFGMNSDNYYPLSHEDSLNSNGELLSTPEIDSIIFERWCSEWTITNASRMNLSEKASEFTGAPLLDFTWDASGTDATSSFSQTDIESTSETGSTELEIIVGANIGLSSVFSVNLEAGTTFSFSNETTQSFSTTSGFELSTDKALEGTKITDEYIALTERLQLSCYLFNNQDADYWYYEILNDSIGVKYPEFKDQKPWYLGYVASRPDPYIMANNTSVSNSQLYSPEIFTIVYTNNKEIIIRYSTPETGYASDKLSIVDMLGRQVRQYQLAYGVGQHEIYWDKTNGKGTKVAKGIYYVVIDNSNQSAKPVIVY